MTNDSRDRDFITQCSEINFSSESLNKEENLQILKKKLKYINDEREIIMNKKLKKITALVAVAGTLICLSMAIYGQDLVRFIKSINLGNHAEYYIIEDDREFVTIPEALRGLVFDKNGIELEVFPEDGILYNESGQEVMPIFDDGTARLMTSEEYEKVYKYENSEELGWRTTYDSDAEGRQYFICETLSPSYLPAGYAFDRLEFYGDPTNPKDIGDGVQKYMNIYYSNGTNEMYTQLRYMDSETAYGTNIHDTIQKINVNGYDAVIGSNFLDVQIDQVMYMFSGNEDVNSDELIKVAESLK